MINNHYETRWRQRIAAIGSPSIKDIRLNYIECLCPPSNDKKGITILIYRLPQTSYPLCRAVAPLVGAGYRIFVVDYRGAGEPSKPVESFTKTEMAVDLCRLVRDHLETKEPIHVVGHDIGSMTAFAYASLYPEHDSIGIWG